MVAQCAVLATEQLAPKTMSRSARGTVDAPGWRVWKKAGLNREILSAGFGMAHRMLAYKAEEAGTRLHLSHTRQLKPSQRCAACWRLVPKTLACACLPVLRTDHASRPRQRVGGAHQRACSAANPSTGHAWNGRGGETQPAAPATGQVQVLDPRNPHDNAMRLAAGEFISCRMCMAASGEWLRYAQVQAHAAPVLQGVLTAIRRSSPGLGP